MPSKKNIKETTLSSKQEVKDFRSRLLRWFRSHKRNLPWRRTKDPYKIWISEVMLQQTTVPVVIAYYHKWMKVFPDIHAVANASLQKILKVWQGLGYYQRAKNIHKTARIIKKTYHGQIPSTFEELLKLPGIGPYTAGAISSIAFHKRYPALEANSRRVLMRILCPERSKATQLEKKLLSFQTQLLPHRYVGHFHQALMELGSFICHLKNPLCLKCPVRWHCLAYKKGKQELLSIKKQRKKIIKIDSVIGIIKKDHQVLIQKRPPKGLLADLWEFPGGPCRSSESHEKVLRRTLKEDLGIEMDTMIFLKKVNHAYTRFRVTLHSYLCQGRNKELMRRLPERCKWVDRKNITQYPFSSGSARLVNFLLIHWHDLKEWDE